MASRKVIRLTPSCVANSRSAGNLSPGPTRPSRMAVSSRSTVSSNAFRARTGRSRPTSRIPSVIAIAPPLRDGAVALSLRARGPAGPARYSPQGTDPARDLRRSTARPARCTEDLARARTSSRLIGRGS